MISLYQYAKRKHIDRAVMSSQDASRHTRTDAKHPSSSPLREVGETKEPSLSTPQGTYKIATSQAQKAEKLVARKYRWKLLLCLWLPFFLASLDLTIVATALPFIASHFNHFNQLNWAVTSFTLTSTAFIPLFGQFANVFGRHSSLQLGIASITIGSVVCAAAPNWAVLLLGRALQGIGTAGVINVVLIILADKVSLKEQAVNQSIFQLLSGIGYSVGPVSGGYLTNENWRYCFVLPACVGALSFITVFMVRKDLVGGTTKVSHLGSLMTGLKTIDVGGAFLFIASIALIILASAWGGSTFPWKSTAVIAPLVLGTALFVTFVFYEYLLEPGRWLALRLPTTVPMIPFSILHNKDVAIVSLIAAGTGAALYSVFYFIGIYFTLVEAYPASEAGTQLLYYIPGLGVGVYAAIFLVNKWPRQTFVALNAGTIIETAGIATLTYAVKSQNDVLVNIMMAIAGIGTGMRFMPSDIHLAGLMRDRGQLAPAYSMVRFSQPFGGTLALTIMGAVFQNKMARYFGEGSTSLHDTASLSAVANLPDDEQLIIRAAGADATMWAFTSILPFLGLSMLASFGLGNVWVQSRRKGDENVEGQELGSVEKREVDRGVYLLNVLRRKREGV